MNTEIQTTPDVQTDVQNTVTVDVVSTTKTPGRPSNPNSARQQKLAAQAAKLEAGEQIALGRPANPDSARQRKIAERQARIDAGEVIKRGRKAMPKDETPVADTTNVTA